MKITVTAFITCKKGELYSDCRDSYAYNTQFHKFAISDGVSKSFFPGIWSGLLVQNFVHNPPMDKEKWLNKGQEEWLANCQQEWQKQVTELSTLPDVKFYTKNAYLRETPGLATFVGLQFFPERGEWLSYALGDSFLFFVPSEYEEFNKDLIKLSSKTDMVFDNFPDYYASRAHQQKGQLACMTGKLVPGTFYLMTDAMAEWFVNQGQNAPGKIAVWQYQEHFQRFIDLARDEQALHNDDSAIMIITLEPNNTEEYHYDGENVTDISQLIKE